jgi:hypothetical protein
MATTFQLKYPFSEHIDNLHWEYLSQNPNAISILEQNLDKVFWPALSENPNAISILEQHLDKVDWKMLSNNPNIFESDYLLK